MHQASDGPDTDGIRGDTSSEFDSAALQLVATSSRFTRAIMRLAGGGGSIGTWRTLAALIEGGPARVGDLADLERIRQPTMTALIRRMENEGLLTRTPDPDDRRATLISVTPAGRARFDAFRREAESVLRPAWERLSDFDQATITRAVELIERLLDEPELSE